MFTPILTIPNMTDEDIYQATVQYQHEFNFPELGRIPIQDCRQTQLYQYIVQSPDFAAEHTHKLANKIIRVYKHGVLFIKNDNEASLHKVNREHLLDDYFRFGPQYDLTNKHVYRISRFCDFITGFTVTHGASHVTNCQIFITGEQLLVLDLSHLFDDQQEDAFHVSFLRNKDVFVFDIGLNYDFCSGIPYFVMPYSEIVFVFTVKPDQDIEVVCDTVMISREIRNNMFKCERPVLFEIDKELVCCHSGASRKFDLRHMKDVGQDICKQVLDRDTSTVVGDYLH